MIKMARVERAKIESRCLSMATAMTVLVFLCALAGTRFARADVDEVSVRLRPIARDFSISGDDLSIAGRLHIPGFSKVRVVRQSFLESDLTPSVWLVSDFVSEKPIGRFTERKLEVRGEALRVDLRRAPSRIQIVPPRANESAPTSKLQLVGVLGLEDYLQGVVSGEVPRDWPEEALKAQAVAARSFVVARIRERRASGPDWLVEATVMDQVFDFEKNHSRAAEAVRATAGEVLANSSGAVIAATYHSDCGGKTDEPGTIWGGTSRVGTAVDRSCSTSSRNTWRFVGTLKELSERLIAKRVLPREYQLASLSVGSRSQGGRAILIDAVSVNGQKRRFTGERLREALGYSQLRSTMFEIGTMESSSGRQLEFTGRGFGHGSGLCQWGARSMAVQGKTYREILRHYYPLLKSVAFKPGSDDARPQLTASGSFASP